MYDISFEDLSVQFKTYLLILHTVALGLIVHIIINVFYNKKYSDLTTKTSGSHARIVHVDDKKVSVDSCQWLNLVLKWLYKNSSSTPDLVKIWLAMLNEKLKIEKSPLNYRINGIVPGSLPPKFTNVYCSEDDGLSQCIALHIETEKLGFFITLLENNNLSGKVSEVEVNITKLSGQLMLQVLNKLPGYDLTVKFIGDPDLQVACQDNITFSLEFDVVIPHHMHIHFLEKMKKDSERSGVEEKLKDVICKTVINIPLTDVKANEQNIDNTLIPEERYSCVDLEGKLLIKIVNASELSCEKGTDVPDAYCVITCKEPFQKKKTNAIVGSKDPTWNESFMLDINSKTKEIAFDVYNGAKTTKEKNFHMDNSSETSSDADTDFLGQVIVPLTMVSKDQTCRLILPILPMSTNSSHVTGQMSLEFSYDKDGERFQSCLQPQSSLAEAAAETKPDFLSNVEERTEEEPQMLVFSMATIDIVEDENDELHLEALSDHGVNRHDIIMAEQCVSEGLPPLKRGVDERYEILVEEKRKQDEIFQELRELDKRYAEIENLPTTEEKGKKATEENNIEEKERPQSQELESSSEIVTKDSTPAAKTPESHEKVQNETKSKDTSLDVREFKLNESLLDDASPNTRRHVFRAAFSERINRDDEVSQEKVSSNIKSSKAPDRSQQSVPSSQLAKSGSDLSLSSLYEGTKSILVVETKDRGEIKNYQIPALMAKRGTFDHKGTKLHIFNDHIFVATHFTGGLPDCDVCKTPLTGFFGKQGYECRDCHMITHKRCHTETNKVCQNSSISSMKIVLLEESSE